MLYKLVFFVPETHKEIVKTAIFAAGAGRYQHYEACCWETLGCGQFRPLAESRPFIGRAHAIERVPEMRVETICEPAVIRAVCTALIAAHPYETPAYEFWPIQTLDDL